MKKKLLEAADKKFDTIMTEDKTKRDKAWQEFGTDVMETMGLFATGAAAAQSQAYVEATENMMLKYGETFVSTQPDIWKEYTLKKAIAGVGQGIDIGTSILAGIKIGNFIGDLGGELLFGINPGELIDAKHAMVALVPLEVEIRGDMNSALSTSYDNSEALYVYTKLLLSARKVGLNAAEEFGEKAQPELQEERKEIEEILNQIDYYYYEIY